MGIVFNAISIYILCNTKMNRSFFNRLLVCLAIVDSVFLATGIYVALSMQVVESLSNSNEHYHHQLIFITILYPARNILMSISIYMTIGLAYERFTSITKPYLYRARETANKCRRLVSYVAPVFIISIIYNLPKFFELKLLEECQTCEEKFGNETSLKKHHTNAYSIHPTDLRKNNYYILWYVNISNLIVTSVVPGILLIIFNYKIYSASNKHRYKKTL